MRRGASGYRESPDTAGRLASPRSDDDPAPGDGIRSPRSSRPRVAKEETMRVTFLRKGSYPFECTVAGHDELGMKGVFVVR